MRKKNPGKKYPVREKSKKNKNIKYKKEERVQSKEDVKNSKIEEEIWNKKELNKINRNKGIERSDSNYNN